MSKTLQCLWLLEIEVLLYVLIHFAIFVNEKVQLVRLLPVPHPEIACVTV